MDCSRRSASPSSRARRSGRAARVTSGPATPPRSSNSKKPSFGSGASSSATGGPDDVNVLPPPALDPTIAPGDGALSTFLLTDIAGSTRMWEEHGAAMGTALALHDELLRSAIT